MPVIVPAELAFAADGTPWSPAYGDVYHSAHGALAQAQHVFLAGNGLSGDRPRWQGDGDFTVLETGFGLGINFLATCAAWQQAGRPGRLHYVAVEAHPFRGEDLKLLLDRFPALGTWRDALLAVWPLPLAGLHRLEVDGISLTLALGDGELLLPQLQLAADAIYLDGFSPERNPALWSPAVMRELVRLARPGATLATWSVAGTVRRALDAAGFAIERRPGFAGKRDMLVGQKPGGWQKSTPAARRIGIVGAGIAGASAAAALRQRGHDVTVFDAAAEPATQASGNLAGVFRPLPTVDDNRLARVLRAGFLLGRRRFEAAQANGARLSWTGVLHLARDEEHATAQREAIARYGLPPGYVDWVDAVRAAALAGHAVAGGGWWFPAGGWINPPSLCRALLAGSDLRTGAAIDTLVRTDRGWQLFHDGKTLASVDEVVVANGTAIQRLLPDARIPVRAGRGQVSHLPASSTPPLDIVVTRQGYVTPLVDGQRCAGATLAMQDADETLRAADHDENLARLDATLPGFTAGVDPAGLGGRVGFRPVSPDRLPICGPLSASDGLWVVNGFGARGLVFAAICAELLADRLSATPLPLEDDLVQALAPGRFAGRTRRQASPQPPPATTL